MRDQQNIKKNFINCKKCLAPLCFKYDAYYIRRTGCEGQLHCKCTFTITVGVEALFDLPNGYF